MQDFILVLGNLLSELLCPTLTLLHHSLNVIQEILKHGNAVKLILKELGKPESLITYVQDRKGHDRRYAIDPAKIHRELGWLPETKFADGIKKTIRWYLNNKSWWQNIVNGAYQNYYKKMYDDKLK